MIGIPQMRGFEPGLHDQRANNGSPEQKRPVKLSITLQVNDAVLSHIVSALWMQVGRIHLSTGSDVFAFHLQWLKVLLALLEFTCTSAAMAQLL